MSKIIFKELTLVSTSYYKIAVRPNEVVSIQQRSLGKTQECIVEMKTGSQYHVVGSYDDIVKLLFDSEPQSEDETIKHEKDANFATSEKWLEFMDAFEDDPNKPLTSEQIVMALSIKRNMRRTSVLSRIDYYVNKGILLKSGAGKDTVYFPNQEEWIAWREGLNKKLPF